MFFTLFLLLLYWLKKHRIDKRKELSNSTTTSLKDMLRIYKTLWNMTINKKL